MNNHISERRIGVGSLLIRDNHILLVLRAHTGRYDNQYGLIGGLVESHESIKQTAIREIDEEIGVHVLPPDIALVHVMSFKEESVEGIGFYFMVYAWQGEPYNKEPHKHASIQWTPLDQLPYTLIARNKQAIEMIQKGIVYSEYGW